MIKEVAEDYESIKSDIDLLRRLLKSADFIADILENNKGLEAEIKALEEKREEVSDYIREEEARLDKIQKTAEETKKIWDAEVEKAKDKVNAVLIRAQDEANQITADARAEKKKLEDDNAKKLAENRRLDNELTKKNEQLTDIQKKMKGATASMQAALSNVGSA